jgi:hypothetical protein
MAGNPPSAVRHRGFGSARALSALLGLIAVAVTAASGTTASTANQSTGIDFAANAIGAPPRDFEFGITGPGRPGRWITVNDASAVGGVAVEQSDHDATEDRSAFAIYRPLSLKNFTASVHLKFERGTIPTAGIAFRFADANNYYVLSANALEGRVDLWRVLDGKMQRIDGREAEVVSGHWHTLRIIAQADAFTVTFDDDWLFTVFDRTFNKDGRLGLWTEEDTLTRFAQFEINALPASEQQ